MSFATEKAYTDFVEDRKNYIGASDAPVLMGVSPWKTLYQLWEDKLGLFEEQEDNWAMRRGRELEPVARAAYSLEKGALVDPRKVVHPEFDYVMANLDGISDDNTCAVEIKIANQEDHALAKQGIIPEKYVPQVQQQLEITNLLFGMETLDYFSVLVDKENNIIDTKIIEVALDEKFIKKLSFERNKFWKMVQNLTPPTLTEKDLKKRNDAEWNMMAHKWAVAKDALDEAKKIEEQARKDLISLSANQSSVGNGVKVIKGLRKGSVDYSLIESLKDIDLEKYRKKFIETWTIKKC